MMFKFPSVAISFALVALVVPHVVDAEHTTSTRVTAGTIQVERFGSSAFAIAGRAGFSFNAVATDSSLALCQPCVAGDTISASTSLGPPFFGSARYRGQSYAFDHENLGGWFALQAPSFTLPPGDRPELTLVEFTTPFTIRNDTVLPLQSGAIGEIIHNLMLSGGGTVTVRLLRYFDEFEQTYLYDLDSLRFDFVRRRLDL
jgi:hypothetical protein